VVAVRWYLRYGLSYRDVEELLAERGIDVDHVTVYRWVQRFTPLLADAARLARHSPGDRWFVDETYVKVNGVWRYVYRAVDEHGKVIDVLLSIRRDAAAARRFLTRSQRMLKVTRRHDVAGGSHGVLPSLDVTDPIPLCDGDNRRRAGLLSDRRSAGRRGTRCAGKPSRRWPIASAAWRGHAAPQRCHPPDS
jgi:hypothetical protein